MEPGHELRLRLGQVERRSVRLGDRPDQEHHERRELRDHVPDGVCEATISLICSVPLYMSTATSASPMPTS